VSLSVPPRIILTGGVFFSAVAVFGGPLSGYFVTVAAATFRSVVPQCPTFSKALLTAFALAQPHAPATAGMVGVFEGGQSKEVLAGYVYEHGAPSLVE